LHWGAIGKDSRRSSNTTLNICHIITDLNTGGAQVMLCKLLGTQDQAVFKPFVVSLAKRGVLGEEVAALGIPLLSLNMKGNPSGGLYRLWRTVREVKPDLIQGWMYHGNIAASLARMSLKGRTRVCWNVRHSLYDIQKEKALTAYFIRLGAVLSKYPDRIVYNSHTSLKQHRARGYFSQKSMVIPNGFDCDRFRPDRSMGPRLRESLGLPREAILIGLIARYHPMKDHAGFLKAAANAASRLPDAHFVLAGKGAEPSNGELARLIGQMNMNGRVHLLGEQREIWRLMAGLSILCSSSAWGEGFPNVIGEAMACGVPCVVTDVGDSAMVVGDTGRVVPPREPVKLGRALRELGEAGEGGIKALGTKARKRVKEHFDLPRIAGAYERLYRSLGPSDRLQRASSCQNHNSE
jgi:glycosyltransferase involved in cell wall biosynthesis